MDFGPDKSATAVFKYGKLPKSQNISLNNQRVIQNMELQETRKNVDIVEGDGIDNSQMKEKLMKEYYYQVCQIPKTKLNSKNMITAINTLAVLILIHSLGIVNWLGK
jgi:phospholipid N-methyltransferase